MYMYLCVCMYVCICMCLCTLLCRHSPRFQLCMIFFCGIPAHNVPRSPRFEVSIPRTEIHTHTLTHTHTHTRALTHTHTHTHTHTLTHTHSHTHTHTHSPRLIINIFLNDFPVSIIAPVYAVRTNGLLGEKEREGTWTRSCA